MTHLLIPRFLFILLIIFMLALIGGIVALFFNMWKKNRSDIIILIDKNNRWKIYHDKIFNKKELTIEKKKYFLVEKCGLLNQKGRVLYIFSENKPQPLSIEYNKAKWLDSQSLNSMLNNDLIQLMLKPNLKPDLLILLGAIGGIIAGASSVLILLIQLEVI